MAMWTRKLVVYRKLNIWDALGTYGSRTSVTVGQSSSILAEHTELDPTTLEMWVAMSRGGGGEHTIAVVLGSVLSSIADKFGFWGTGGIAVAFALLEPAARPSRFLGGVAQVLPDIEGICFQGASSPMHLHPVFFVQAIRGDGES
jgi:hypothetical protein